MFYQAFVFYSNEKALREKEMQTLHAGCSKA